MHSTSKLAGWFGRTSVQLTNALSLTDILSTFSIILTVSSMLLPAYTQQPGEEIKYESGLRNKTPR